MKGKFQRPAGVVWANDERLLVTLKLPVDLHRVEVDAKKDKDFDIRNYYMYERMLSVNREAKDPIVLLSEEKGLRGNRRLTNVFPIKNDNRFVIMSAFKNYRLRLFRVNVFNGASEQIAEGGDRTIAFVINNAGEPTYRLDYIRNAKKLVIKAPVSGKWKKIDSIDFDDYEDETNEAVGSVVGLYHNQLAYRRRNETTGFYELVVRNSSDHSLTTLVSLNDQDIEDAVVDRFGEIIGYFPIADIVRFSFFDKNKQANYDRLASLMGGYNFRLFGSWGQDYNVVQVYGRDRPGSFYLYDAKLGELSFIQDQFQNLAKSKLGTPLKTRYKARDGLNIEMYLLLPPGYQKGVRYPLVLLPHGGPHARDYASYDEFAQFIATRGYVVAQPNFRGSTGYGK